VYGICIDPTDPSAIQMLGHVTAAKNARRFLVWRILLMVLCSPIVSPHFAGKSFCFSSTLLAQASKAGYHRPRRNINRD
jgi:hypothetical protein